VTGHKGSMTSELDDFRRVFDASYPKLMAYARRRADSTAADDVVAETFLVAWRRRDEFLNLERQLPWLYAVAANQLRNQDRSTNRHLRLVAKAGAQPAEVEAPADGGLTADSDAELLRQALKTLSFDDQEVLRLIAWEELSYHDAAEVLGCSTDAVAQRIRRAKQRLTRAMAHIEPANTNTPSPEPDPSEPDSPIAEVR